MKSIDFMIENVVIMVNICALGAWDLGSSPSVLTWDCGAIRQHAGSFEPEIPVQIWVVLIWRVMNSKNMINKKVNVDKY